MSKKQFSVRLEEELYQRLENYRWENRKSLNDAMTEAVEEFVKNKGLDRDDGCPVSSRNA